MSELNILITGTPGVGKTTFAIKLVNKLNNYYSGLGRLDVVKHWEISRII